MRGWRAGKQLVRTNTSNTWVMKVRREAGDLKNRRISEPREFDTHTSCSERGYYQITCCIIQNEQLEIRLVSIITRSLAR